MAKRTVLFCCVESTKLYAQQFLIAISALHVFVWSEDHSGLFSGAHLQLESLLFRYFQP